ncbi:MAG TPA: hypothetical protein VFR42_10940, partial [Candidatus Acidoferrum sp.]|nr:hypothetical protein [Candidatus Acidoferrum sp.]
MLKYLVVLGLLTVLGKRRLGATIPWPLLLGGVTAFLSLGMSPYLTSFARPETGVIIGLCVLCLLTIYMQR